MSAFIVSDETMHRVVDAVQESNACLHNMGLTKATKPDLIGRALYHINELAVRARYGDNRPPDLTAPQTYRHKPSLSSEVERYKAASCLLYQCSEGDVPETPTFRALADLTRAIGHRIIAQLPEYRAAAWD